MTRQKKNTRSAHPAPTGDPVHALTRFLGPWFVLLLILYAALLAASRTAGFAALVERRLARSVSLAWHVESARFSPALTLCLEGVRGNGEDGNPVFQADTIRIGMAGKALLRGRFEPRRLYVGGALLRFGDPAFSDSPDAWSAWASRLHPGGTAIPSPFPARPEAPANRLPWPPYPFQVENADIEWRNRQGDLVASARSLWLRAHPLMAPDRRFTHLELAAEEWTAGPNAAVFNLKTEWLAHDNLRWILLLESGLPLTTTPPESIQAP